MPKDKSYDAILKDLREKKQSEVVAKNKFADCECKICGKKLADVGRSWRIQDVCKLCIHDATTEPQSL